jgi:hypothetical protein
MFLSSLFLGPQFVPNRSQRIRVLYHESAPLEGKPLPQRLRWKSADHWVDFILRGCKGDVPFVVPELSLWTLDWISGVILTWSCDEIRVFSSLSLAESYWSISSAQEFREVHITRTGTGGTAISNQLPEIKNLFLKRKSQQRNGVRDNKGRIGHLTYFA